MDSITAGNGRLKAFAYVNAEKAELYRAIMGAFVTAKSQFKLHLRPAEIATAFSSNSDARPLAEGELDLALIQLCEWRNLDKYPDTAAVATVDDFYRARFLFQITAEGEAAERAVEVYEEHLRRPGELQAAALSDIRELLSEFDQLGSASALDESKVHRTLRSLAARFDELTSKAQSFIRSLMRPVDLYGAAVAVFVEYKHLLIDYLERFIGELVLRSAEIVHQLRRVEACGIDRMLAAAARRDLADAFAPSEDDRAAALGQWQSRWQGLRCWFIASGGSPAQAEVLRSQARSAIPALVAAVSGIHDRRLARSDRSADLRTLARWFAQTDSAAQAHRLWRAAFGLAPARHLLIDQQTLDDRDTRPVSARESWWTAAPLWLSPRLRRTGRHQARGRSNGVIDRATEKALLAQLVRDEAEQIRTARRRLATGHRVRLRELGLLDPLAFDLLLDLLGEALSRKIDPAEEVEALSSDGSLIIHLEPTGDGASAVIQTHAGSLYGPDHFVTICDTFQERDSTGTTNRHMRSAPMPLLHDIGPLHAAEAAEVATR